MADPAESPVAASAAGQDWHPERYAQNACFVPALGRAVLDLLAPRRGERVLDLGCGDGVLTEAIAAAGAQVVGVDAGPEMVARARERGLDARVMDGRALDFAGEFEAVFSNAALHWMTDHAAVARGVARALVPGGRFVGEFGGHGNVAAIRTALHAVLRHRNVDPLAVDPWTFPTDREWSETLDRAGFRIDRVELFARPTPLPTDMAGWLATFAEPFLNALPGADRETARDEAVELLRPALCDRSGQWIADYMRLRFVAVVP